MTIMILSGVLGFLLASLIALFLAPPLWRRAVRVTTKRLMQQSPRMIDEGHADRDQMRAEFAVSTRKMEVKIDRLKEVSDTQLIELSKAEKKRDRMQGKIESLQSSMKKREVKIEKLGAKTDKLLGDIGKKSEQLTTQAERLTRQTEMLNAQAAALDENVIELDIRKQKLDDYASKEVDSSAIISKQDLELSELRDKQRQIKKSHKTEGTAHKQEFERLARKISDGLQEIASLKEDLEARKQATVRLRQEVGKNKEKISELIRQVHTRDEKIEQLGKKTATPEIDNAEQPDTDSAIGESNADKSPPATLSKTASAPVASIADNSNNEEGSLKDTETPVKSTRRTPPKERRPVRIARSSRKKTKPVELSDSLSLAERIRALQTDHTKSM